MDEKNGSEIILLRQAVARLSDRIEHLEQKLRKIERGWNPAARPAETNVQMNERESAPQAKIASLEIPVPPSPPPPPKNIQPQIPAPSFTTPAPRPLQPVPPPAPPQARVPPVEKPPAPPQSIPAFTSTPEIPAPGGGAEQPQPETAQKDKHRRDIELNIGKYWLNKIGIGVFVLGVGFLIAYSSKYFGQLGPWGKILTGYLVSAVLFFVGRKFEHDEKMVNFGYVLTGGAWALTYFTTFSMQHFPQSRVLESEGLDLVFLAAVGAGMLIHSLKYRSEALSGVAIFVGYATATIGDVRFFTLISCAIESIVILILVYKFKWLRMMFMGILMTYGAHFLWVMKNIHGAGDAAPVPDAKSFFVMNGTFLTLYWAVFTAGIHLLRKDGDETLESRLAVANIGNALFYFLLLYPDVTRFFPDQRFNFVMSLGTVFLLLGVCLFKSGKDKLFASDTMLGLALMTAAVPIKYMTLQTALIWIAELPFLCYAGIELKSRTIRFAAFLLFIWIMLHYAFYVAGSAGRVEIMGLGGIPMSGFTAFAAALSFGGVFTMLRLGFARGKISALENTFTQAFLPATAMFLSLGTVITSAPQNLTLYLFLDALLLFVWGYLADEAPVRIYSLLFLAWGILRFIGIDDYHALTAFRRWAYIAWEVMCGYSIAYLYRDLRNRNMLQKIESGLVTAVTAGSGILVLTAVLRYVPENWITFTFSGLSLLIFAVACLLDSRSLRASALAGSALVAWRFVLVDSFPSAGFADWLIIAFPPFSQAGIYLLYRKLRAEGKLPEAERAFPDLGYVLLQITLMALALRYISGWKMTAAFAVMNLALFGAGCLLREKLVRYASLAAMPVVLFRFLAIDDYPHGGRVWPLIFVLGSYYALVYAYVKAAATRILETDESQFSHLACAAAAFLSAVAIWKYAPEYWAAAIMALAGLAVFLYGYFWDSSDMRVSGCALLFTSLFRAVFWDDYSSLGAAMRWLPPTVELFSFAISYWFYRNLRLAQKLSPDEAAVSQSLCAGLSALACVSITRYCPPYWASSTLAVFTAAMFFAGLALGEMFVRVCSCLMFTIVAGRAMIFSEPYENLGRLRWLPIGAQLVSLLGVYLPYRGLAKRGPVTEEEAMVPLAVYAGFLFLLIFHIGHYGGETSRPLAFTGCYLALFACGILRGDTPLRASWLPLLPAAIIAYVSPMPKFSSLACNFAYAAAISAGMYVVYIFSEHRLKPLLSKAEKKLLPALCLASAIILLLSADHYAPGTFKTAAAALCLFALYLAGAGLRDDMLALSGFIFMPYIFMRRLGYDGYAGVRPLVKWSAVLSAPAAFLGVYWAELKNPGRVFKDAGFSVSFWAGIIPGALFLLHAIFFYASSSLITLSLGVSGLFFFAPGFRFKDKPLRYAGLLMFAAAVLRIGVVDIAGLPILYKIISFIIMGLILLAVSYIYTRFALDESPDRKKQG